MSSVKLPQYIWHNQKDVEYPLPDSWKTTVHNIAGHNNPALKLAGIKKAIASPIGMPPLRELAKGKKQVVIIFDDMTRGTRVYEIVPAVLEELHAAGITDNQIRFIAAVANHSLLSTRQWLSVAVGEPPPDRDRPTEFEYAARDSGELLALVDGMFEECLALVDKSREVDWGALRRHWDATRDIELFAAWALLHAVEHLREHVGQISLTRQLWERRLAPG